MRKKIGNTFKFNSKLLKPGGINILSPELPFLWIKEISM